jgi:hypothetical protein
MLRKNTWAFLALLVCLMAFLAPRAAWCADKPRLTATFLQPLFEQADRSLKQWRELFTSLKTMGVSECILQWTLFDDRPFYASKAFKTDPVPLLETILGLADEFGLKITLGLVHDPDYWIRIKRDPKLVRVYLRRLYLDSMKLAEELAEIATQHKSVTGWYIPQEIDDKTWLAPDAKKALFEYLGDLTKGLRKAAPDFSVSVSGFSNAFADPDTCGTFWGELVAAAGLDRVLLQDGIGVGKLEIGYAGLYLNAASKAVRASGGLFTPVVETFVQTGGEPINAGPFAAEPAPLARIETQMALAAASDPTGIAAFSIPEYMTPQGGAKAAALFHEYLSAFVH